MTTALFREDAYLHKAEATVTAITSEGAILLDQTVFYPTSGGQPGDSGTMSWGEHTMEIATTQKGEGDSILHLPAEPAPLPSVGTVVTTTLNWERRYRHMRMHTALHLLSVVIPLPVSGGAIGAEKGRLDFNMPDAPDDKAALETDINRLIDCNMNVTNEWITQEALDAQPELVKTMSVQPPRGHGKIRLVRIGVGQETADLQPCGGTHVANTSEIGRVRIGKIEKKGRQNRRVYLHFD